MIRNHRVVGLALVAIGLVVMGAVMAFASHDSMGAPHRAFPILSAGALTPIIVAVARRRRRTSCRG